LKYVTPFAKDDLQHVYDGILTAVEKVADHLRFSISSKTETSNDFGELQLDTDVHTDNLIFQSLKDTGCVYAGISEEKPQMVMLNEDADYIVTFDPLDGSSVIDANMTVGSIFAIWKKKEDK
jgi:fructose-1,6-bisphosphatase I